MLFSVHSPHSLPEPRVFFPGFSSGPRPPSSLRRPLRRQTSSRFRAETWLIATRGSQWLRTALDGFEAKGKARLPQFKPCRAVHSEGSEKHSSHCGGSGDTPKPLRELISLQLEVLLLPRDSPRWPCRFASDSSRRMRPPRPGRRRVGQRIARKAQREEAPWKQCGALLNFSAFGTRETPRGGGMAAASRRLQLRRGSPNAILSQPRAVCEPAFLSSVLQVQFG